MLGLIIYVGLFVWGMQTERLGWKPIAIIVAVAVAQAMLGIWMLGGLEAAQMGAMSVISLGLVFVIELAIDLVAFFAGYGIGRFRRRGQTAQDDLGDTFS